MKTENQIVKKVEVTICGKWYKKGGITNYEDFEEELQQIIYVPIHVKDEDITDWIMKQFKFVTRGWKFVD